MSGGGGGGLIAAANFFAVAQFSQSVSAVCSKHFVPGVSNGKEEEEEEATRPGSQKARSFRSSCLLSRHCPAAAAESE